MQKRLKAIKNLFIIFLYTYIKWLINITKKKTKKSFEKKPVKGAKSFWRKRKRGYHCDSTKNYSEEEKQEGWIYEKLLFSTQEIILRIL